MKIEIDIDEYFTPEMIKEIAEDELRRAFRWQFQKESDVERAAVFDDVIDWIKYAPALTPPNEWVNVEERLPEVDDSVLVYIIDTFNNRGNIVITKYTIGLNSKMEWLGFEHNSFKATHWMPLPAPPDHRTTEGAG